MRYKIDYEPAWSAPLLADVNSVYTPSNFGSGNYGAGDYGPGVGVSSVVYQEEFHLNERCQAIAFRFEDLEVDPNYGPSFELSELLLTGGMLGPAFVPGASRQN